MRYLLLALCSLFLCSPLSAEQFYQNSELGFTLSYPDSLFRETERETDTLQFFLRDGRSTLLLLSDEEKPDLEALEFANSVAGPELELLELDGVPFYAKSEETTTGSGTPIQRTTFINYNPQGSYLFILVTSPIEAQEAHTQLLDVVATFKVTAEP